MAVKRIIGYINAENELEERVLERAADYERNGADALYLYNFTMVEKEREAFYELARQAVKVCDIPVMAGCYVERFEDVKKMLYTGAAMAVIEYAKLKGFQAVEEASKRFGKEKIAILYDGSPEVSEHTLPEEAVIERLKDAGVGNLMLKHVNITKGVIEEINALPFTVYIRDSLMRNDISMLLSIDRVEGVATDYYEEKDIGRIKRILKEEGAEVDTFESRIPFSAFKTDQNGLVPVVVQDYKTAQVLMVAYMNEEAFDMTVQTGKMTYFSRSRQSLWIKGETSGHYQYVKSLKLDCDNDTILAKVAQIGAACHTGEKSCFFQELVTRKQKEINAYSVLTELYDVIMDRKVNKKEGSYTNYLFDKGLDKILKKCGEEASEIIIAAKNPDKEELKYEIADFLYHMIVLMAERGLDLDDIMMELANRR
ncbi:MAG: bifunctional phosphoribosyl-AMP cyclohydrolase/phosphoribosyl-ATP diphosphatase HisIE [Lachnospiraceae bacterium]|nr:bifunctional phosphoribosyl-AMP cyclohydrolase/phosphoribosyl-ATP diphosphatase HisIE [Lachnospiraceae bacterium]